jgi:hypothetical protein
MVTAPTPEQAAANAFVTGCARRGITASMAAVPPEGQLATVRGLWADVAQAAVDAATEGALRACGYTLADVGRFLEAEAAAPAAPESAPDPAYVVIRRRTGEYARAYGPYGEAEADRYLGEPRDDNEARSKITLGADASEDW